MARPVCAEQTPHIDVCARQVNPSCHRDQWPSLSGRLPYSHACTVDHRPAVPRHAPRAFESGPATLQLQPHEFVVRATRDPVATAISQLMTTPSSVAGVMF